ncbi:MAG: NnrS family protein [Acetobacteraceae bacterium]|nr:NnrS family protein [Acetobacteraceae bacterium]
MALRAHSLFFPLAIAQGIAGILLWSFAGLPPPDHAAWHAHEMIFGYSLAVLAGFLLTRLGPRLLLVLAGAWIAARIGCGLAGTPVPFRAVLALLPSLGIPLCAAMTFLQGTKRRANLAFPVLIAVFPLAELLFQAGELARWQGGIAAGMWLGLGAVLTLIAVMGGRVVGAAVSGAVQRAGGARIPPRLWLERAQLLALAGGFVALAWDAPGPAAILLSAGGALFLLRLALLLPGLWHSPADILGLMLGQAWLGLGLLGFGASALRLLPLPPIAVLHLATIGGIGTTTLVMMLRTIAQRDRGAMPVVRVLLAAAFMGGAALLRAFGLAVPDLAFPAAALAWALALLLAIRRPG